MYVKPLTTTLIRTGLLLPLVATLLAGCVSRQPQPLMLAADLQGVQSNTIDNVTVSVAILTDEQAQQHFGADFAKNDLQALWIRVRNATGQQLWFIRNTVDPDFYSADEAAVLLKDSVSGSEFPRLRQLLRDESIRVQHRPMMITEGFLYLPRVEGGRYVDIRLARDRFDADTAAPSAGQEEAATVRLEEIRFGFAVPLPDGLFDYERLDTEHTYGDAELPDVDLDGLRAHLEALPCCAMNADGEDFGDPLNVVLIGDSYEVLAALTRSGWSFTHRISLESLSRMVGSAIGGHGYPVAPVSNLYLFGRKQDFALQRARPSISQRNHSRYWLAPFTHNGRQVWVGQVSRDIGIKVTPKSPSLTTHIIDPEVDLTREYLLHSLLDSGLVERFGFVNGSKPATPGDPAFNLTGDPYFSDGLRVVIDLSSNPLPYNEVRSLLWERSAAPMAEGQSESARRYVRPLDEEDSR